MSDSGKEKEEDDEDMSGVGEDRNWKGMFIATLVIASVFGCVILAVFMLSEEDCQNTGVVELEDLFNNEWKEDLAKDSQWIADNLIWEDKNGDVKSMSKRGNSVKLLPKETLEKYGSKYKISPDMKYALYEYDTKSLYAHSYNTTFGILKIEQDQPATQICEEFEFDGTSVFQYVGFGPTGSQLIFILNGDIYYLDTIDGEECPTGQPVRLTDTGEYLKVTNGLADFIYEEHILKTHVAHWWSPDGKYLAYAQFDDTEVKKAYVTTYGEYNEDVYQPYPYPKEEDYYYPKAGNTNPTVTVHIINLETSEDRSFAPPAYKNKKDKVSERLTVLHSLQWLSDSRSVVMTWSDRYQVSSTSQMCTLTKSKNSCKSNIAPIPDSQKSGKWMPDLNKGVLPSNDPNIYFAILPRTMVKTVDIVMLLKLTSVLKR